MGLSPSSVPNLCVYHRGFYFCMCAIIFVVIRRTFMKFEEIIKQVKEKPYIPENWGNTQNPVLMSAFWEGHAAKSAQIAEALYCHGVSPEIAIKVVDLIWSFDREQ